MIVVFGLGPIGAGIGSTLAKGGYDVIGVDLDADRANQWSEKTGNLAVTDTGQVDWSGLEAVIVAVRLGSHLPGVFSSISSAVADLPVSTIVVTTLSIGEARNLAARRSNLRILEAPVSGGEWAASDGTLTIYLHAPDGESDAESLILETISARLFHFNSFGEPAVAKLINNTLGAYNALATSALVDLAAQQGLSRQTFLDIVNVSSGHSWMSEHFEAFPQDLLFKDVALLQRDVLDLPTISMAGILDQESKIQFTRDALRGS